MAEGNGAAELRVAEVEAALSRIPSITAARVVTGPGGRITEVHVLAGRERSPKQLVRDVQSVALASFGVEVDYRTVSVVQLEDPTPPAAPVIEQADEAPPAAAPARDAGPRPALIRVGTEISGHASEVRVALRAGASELTGSARGAATGGEPLVCRAVVDALGPMLGGTIIDVERAEVIEAGTGRVAICVVRAASDARDLAVVGAAMVRRDPSDAIARATLDALNRWIGSPLDAHDAQHEASPSPPSAEKA